MSGERSHDVVAGLDLDEKAAISAGSGFFTFTGVPRLGIPDWATTDGPNGARGSSFLGSGDSQATCIPSGSALGATFDPGLVEELGVVLGRETRTKQARVLLAPTVNLHRSPLAGRNFECFSEDPLLSGLLAAAYIRGVQSQGVVTTVKHFVGNECETDRQSSNSVIGERALRELYLVPFEYAVKRGRTLGVMTAYNRVNGDYCNDQRGLLTDVLRDEWGFDGFVTTDWMAGADTVAAANAGLDIEMPAGNRAFGTALAAAVRDGRVPESVVDTIASRMLSVFERIGAWNDEGGPEQSIDLPEHREVARRAAAAAMVLLRNEPVGDQPILPVDIDSVRSIAVIGPNATRAQIMGGGSANLRPFHRTSPIEAMRARFGERVEIVFEPGCSTDKSAPLLSGTSIRTPSGEQGFSVELFDNRELAGEPRAVVNRDTSRFMFGDDAIPGVEMSSFSMRATTQFTTAGLSGDYIFEVTQVSPTRVLLDGDVIVDGVTAPPAPGAAFFGFGAAVAPVTVRLEFGSTHDLIVEMVVPSVEMFAGVDVGVRMPMDADSIERATAAAAAADLAVVVVGTNDDWETEGEDRVSLALPGDQDALVAAVVAANPNTIVVVNTGAPVLMPWAGDVPAIVQSWFGGQEMAEALVDVIVGDADPGGRLPTTFPTSLRHTPSYGNFPGDNGQVDYAEGVFIGYRWYDARGIAPLFPFGHGGSYTTFEIAAPVASAERITAGDAVSFDVEVTNTGSRRGSEVIQCYVRPTSSRLIRPDQELKAFGKVTLEPGESQVVTLELDDRSFAYWDPAQPEWPDLQARTSATLPHLQRVERQTEPGWRIDAGPYEIVIARSSADPVHTVVVDVVSED
ncbi:MAG: glycoside hydrolase family 3 C-terminal domain-containing protein [Ilumatobacteraceae bacterium]